MLVVAWLIRSSWGWGTWTETGARGETHRGRIGSGRSSRSLDLLQRPALVAALERDLEDRADPALVELGVEHSRLERRPFVRDQPVAVDADDPEVVLGLALVVLLAKRLSDARVRGHEDAGAGAIDARPPRSGTALHLSVAVELLGVLPQIPDIAARVLGVVVERFLGDAAAQDHPVVDDGGRHAQDPLRVVRDGEHVDAGDAVGLAGVAQRRAGRQREPRVVHARDERDRRDAVGRHGVRAVLRSAAGRRRQHERCGHGDSGRSRAAQAATVSIRQSSAAMYSASWAASLPTPPMKCELRRHWNFIPSVRRPGTEVVPRCWTISPAASKTGTRSHGYLRR